MLPSKGFFKKNDCPFFDKGLCVRPHCHFRHRKQVLNDHSSNREEDVEEDEEAEEALLKLIADSKHLSDIDKKPCTSTSEPSTTEDKSAHGTLFAKLVNQNNSYEKVNRHIPCAYTPTPQTRKIEVKRKSASGIAGFANTEKSLELITKARTLLQNYCAENIKRNENKVSGSGDCKSEASIKILDRDQSSSVQDIPSASTGVDEMVPTEEESENDEINIPNSLDGDTQRVTGSSDTNLLRPASSEITEQTKTNNEDISNTLTNADLSGDNSQKSDISEVGLLSSEIKMTENLLNEDENQGVKTDIEKKDKQDSEEKENKNKDETKRKSGESSHSHSRHKSKSSRNHSSSRSGHSSSHSSSRHSSSSSRHRSSSSRSHSSSRNRKSSRHDRSSSRHSREHKERRHSEKCKSESQRKEQSRSRQSNVENKDKSAKSNTKSSSTLSDEEQEEEDDADSDVVVESNRSGDDNAKDGGVTLGLKRKNSSDEEFPASKYISLSNYEGFADTEEDPDVIEKECLEIFNSYSTTGDSVKIQEIAVPNAEYENTVQAKKRTAHSTSTMADHSALRHKTVKKVHNIKSPHELMLERYKVAEKDKEVQPLPQLGPAPIIGLARPSVKIAAVSNIQQMLLAKKKIQEKISQGIKVNERTTIAQTVSQGGSRVAHVPKVADLKEKPTILEGSKQVPRIKRQAYLDKLLVETSKIYPTKHESAEEALKLEEDIFKRYSASTTAYHAAFVCLLMKTRRRVASVKGETATLNASKPKVSHFDVLSGGKKNFSVIKTKKVDISMLTEKQIYEELLRCKLTPEELKENGFPMSSGRLGYATCKLNLELKYNEKYQHIKKVTGNRRYCVRCSKLYDVDPVTWKQSIEGPETCSYHPGRKKSGGRNCERVYSCCNTSSTEGCASHIRHVTDSNDYENFPNCVTTLAKGEENPGVYALDCEMVYTRLGSELARVTVVNLKKEIVYDTLVKPKYPIECYNTFYSGIEEKMMQGVETTLQDVQAVLLSMFSNKTILIGHSLDSDLRALHLVHDTVVDTSVVYKNEKYFPYKYSLKDLCAKKISKIIQDNVNGHDSSEDAIAALEIMLQHVKEEVAKYDCLKSYEADRGH